MIKENKLIAFCLTASAEALLSRMSNNGNQRKGAGKFLHEHSDILGL